METITEEANRLGLLNGDKEHDARVKARLWFHYNTLAA